MLALEIGTKQDTLELVEFFDRFPLRAKKARDFAIWRDAVLEWQTKGRGIGRNDWSRMAQLHQGLDQRQEVRLMEPRTYTVEISRELAEKFTSWTRVRDIEADWFKVVPQKDGTAEVWFQIGEKPRSA